MTQFFFTSPGLVALSGAVITLTSGLIATPANAATFKGTIYKTWFPILEGFQLEYTLNDEILDTVLASEPNTFFMDGEYLGPAPSLPMSLATVVPEVVTDFKMDFEVWTDRASVPMRQFSIFGITEEGLFLQLLDVNQPPIYQNIFMSIIQAPEGLPLSACKTQACDASADFGGKGGLYDSRMTHIPVPETSQPVPEPSAAIALGFVGALLLKRRRKTLSLPGVATAHPE